jgi:hypothetical protein
MSDACPDTEQSDMSRITRRSKHGAGRVVDQLADEQTAHPEVQFWYSENHDL